ncbi:isocitrate lyase/PEP mutase family protein [Paenarthrobacter aromaticivorans]|uniref:Isocitrate lyase/PEP mutase family protein n=1 Tax=Paenarthrobacter aromaticivorans TaxID=2849150 RepID=A0ABS6I9V2_9MICC|nr:isocitrate lyase/PEP mutase family protein [Paenarthrobacter sp. MMS21-TAE1-1]MBU8868490.1 isocitrate lyase/PEP mutase family protein [Paenarthrobacter sp. MMS21-TAE1-1]
MTFSKNTVRSTTALRTLLSRPGVLHMPGCYDALSARLIELAGFDCAAISGFAVEATHLGGPDIGLMTMTELTQQAGRITEAVDIPVISDVDTGFGGIQNIHRTIRAAENAGLAGVHIEDQALPKRCPVLPGRVLVSIEEASDRIAVAVEARRDPDFVIIARTDGDSVSFEDQIERANAYMKAGADLVMPMMVQYNDSSFSDLTPDRQMGVIQEAAAAIDGPVMYVGDAPEGYSSADLGEVGVKIASPSALTLEAAVEAVRAVLEQYRSSYSSAGYFADKPNRLKAGRPILDTVRVGYYLDLEERYTRQRA